MKFILVLFISRSPFYNVFIYSNPLPAIISSLNAKISGAILYYRFNDSTKNIRIFHNILNNAYLISTCVQNNF